MTQFALPATPETPPVELLDPTPEGMRRALGAFASGVTVVTAVADGEPVGFTCQSFASVSLEPPLVMFCAGREGRAWGRIRSAEALCVNVLAEDQIDVCGRFGSRTGARFDGLDHELSDWGAPALPGALLRVHCSVTDVHVAGDHDIAVCHVLGLELGTEVPPLVFHRGRFGLRTQRPVQAADLWGWNDRWG
ncbi:flavin reductase family protein [Nocardioides sp. CCNWLW239]|uniref:flavin reductase family protein n=1 Tax=Nocardioides sp. CCNWLW239 TaxID=3128902 RepID=UPI003019BF2B